MLHIAAGAIRAALAAPVALRPRRRLANARWVHLARAHGAHVATPGRSGGARNTRHRATAPGPHTAGPARRRIDDDLTAARPEDEDEASEPEHPRTADHEASSHGRSTAEIAGVHEMRGCNATSRQHPQAPAAHTKKGAAPKYTPKVTPGSEPAEPGLTSRTPSRIIQTCARMNSRSVVRGISAMFPASRPSSSRS